ADYLRSDKIPKSSHEAHEQQHNPIEYAQQFIFPVLLPGLVAMLRKAKENNCFERKQFRFNGLDFLTLYLYQRRWAKSNDEIPVKHLADIPWVAKEWAIRPRPPLPLSLQWTEEEAATKLQAYWRGFSVRRQPEVQELRQWQYEWRLYNRGELKPS
ncbi:hypothetical protein CRM22_011011, partial [Opisthorchis felineus]